eukprot:CAMPEP_0183358264 /NCGR_PEP_ID=MMETSP0164_2-20130417/48673_1 /TAXON_ID=221442 /ORGANISM="Coccolithus pelagicus ssp braarudi, Strain PLY182g" /LENGTH=49 /DNA_ID= /DNA_START= /DNA_END= /DNA_ORIENTATION=
MRASAVCPLSSSAQLAASHIAKAFPPTPTPPPAGTGPVHITELLLPQMR